MDGKLAREYGEVFGDVAALLEAARKAASRSVNSVMTATYWLVGRRIVEGELQGQTRSEYGEFLVTQLARDLATRFGNGFRRRNLFQMKAFYLAHRDIIQTVSAPVLPPDREILQAAPVKTPSLQHNIVQTASALSSKPPLLLENSGISAPELLTALTGAFPLPWSHYARILTVRNPHARAFYEAEALRGGWTVRQLDRQIQSQFYERTALSRNKAALLRSGSVKAEPLSPEDTIRSPYVLEFLGLKDEYSEADLEEALIRNLETFLLELGDAFTFVGRQRRVRVGDEWYRVDLVFFHRGLRSLFIVDLKLGRFSHADAGQMHLYLNYAREHWVLSGENPPVGLILCTEKDEAVARYALDGLPNPVLATEYRTTLPSEAALVARVLEAQRALSARRGSKARGPRG